MSQVSDCVGAIVICSDGPVAFNPDGVDSDDFANPNNSEGCLLTGEFRTVWYYFEFNRNMPPDSEIEFNILPDGGFGEDYDFAIYGPNLACDSLGAPVRCSFARNLCDFCPNTGLGMGATDVSEPAVDQDGFVRPMVVQPGDGFYLLLDNWYGTSNGFLMTWGGSAAPFLNCLADPDCIGIYADAGADRSACAGDTLFFAAETTGVAGPATFNWSAEPAYANAFFDDRTVLSPSFIIPDTFSGELNLAFSVTVDECVRIDEVSVTVGAMPEPEILGTGPACPGTTTTIGVSDIFASYEWSNDASTRNIIAEPGRTYTVTVTNAEGCSGIDSFTVPEFPLTSVNIVGDSVICGIDAVTVDAGPGFSNYQWSNSTSLQTLSTSDPGPYAVTVTDANGCISADTIILAAIALPVPALPDLYDACQGGAALLDAGPGFTSYQWSDASDEQVLNTSLAGDYSVTVTDQYGCEGIAGTTVVINDLPVPVVVGPADFCEGTDTQFSTDQSYAAYLWSTSETSPSISVDSGGNYSVTVTDNNGCTGIASITAAEIPAPTLPPDLEARFCEGASATLNAGPGYASYLWEDNTVLPTRIVNTAGNYSLTLTGDNGCAAVAEYSVTEIQNPEPAITGATAICEGAAALVEVEAAYAAYLWSDNSNGATFSTNQPGAYGLTVTDADGCQGSVAFMVSSNPNPVVALPPADSLCSGESLLLDAGPGFSAYLWSTSETSPSISVDMTGNYSVTVTDSNGCTGIANVAAVEIPLPMLPTDLEARFCEGASATLNAGPGYASYLWEDNTILPSRIVNTAGNYSLTLTGDNGCVAVAEFSVTEIQNPEPAITGAIDICEGETALVEAGDTYAAYLWSDNSNGATFSTDQPGAYGLTVTDADGCQGSVAFTVSNYPNPVVALPPADSLCQGESLVLDAGPGFPTYLWSSGEASRMLEVTDPGSYTVTVIDENGCEASQTVVITSLSLPAIDLGPTIDLCLNEQDTVDAGGGFLEYLWSDNTSDRYLVVAESGDYTVTVTDLNGCVNIAAVTAIQRDDPVPSIVGDGAFCQGAATLLTAGESWSTYRWSDPAQTTTPQLTVEEAGIYTLTVTNEWGCIGATSREVVVLPAPQPAFSGQLMFCPGDTGTIDAGGGFLAYQWENGGDTQQIAIDTAGLYRVTVTDANGCTGAGEVTAGFLPVPDIEITGVSTVCAGSSTTLTASPGFALYQWSTGEETQQITVAEAGAYQVTVTNAEGCAAKDTGIITVLELPVALSGEDGGIDCREPAVALGGPPNANFQYSWTGPGIDAGNEHAANPAVNLPGTYNLVVTDANTGCESLAAEVVVIDLRFLPAVALQADDLLSCTNAGVLIDAQGSADESLSTYQWLDPDREPIAGSDEALLEATVPGWHYLIVTDDLTGCVNIDSIEVAGIFQYPEFEIFAEGEITCDEPQFALALSITANGGPAPVISWTSAQGHPIENPGSPDPLVSRGGLYFVTVENTESGCTRTDSVSIAENVALPLADAGPDQQMDCIMPLAGLSAVGVQPTYTYEWTRPDGAIITATTLQTAQPGTYLLSVTNPENGCTATDVVEVTEYESQPVGLDLAVDQFPCYGEEAGSVAVREVIGGEGPFIFSLNGAPFSPRQVYSELAPAAYTIAVQDAAGCEYETTFVIEQGVDVLLDLGEDQVIKLGQTVRLEALTNLYPSDIDSIGISSPEAQCGGCHEWAVTPLQTSTYNAAVIDTNGCKAVDQVTIYVDRTIDIYIPNAFSPNNDGINDIFVIYAGESVTSIKSMTIVNRWGDMVFRKEAFQPNNPAHGWNGKFLGRVINPDVFVYMLEIELIDGRSELIKGDITLVR